MFNTYVSGPRAIREIRELIRPWGDGEHARFIRAVLDRNGV
jgi:transcription termination factor NusB